jgi:hypothetical protein
MRQKQDISKSLYFEKQLIGKLEKLENGQKVDKTL